jgi:hypothetical protein
MALLEMVSTVQVQIFGSHLFQSGILIAHQCISYSSWELNNTKAMIQEPGMVGNNAMLLLHQKVNISCCLTLNH